MKKLILLIFLSSSCFAGNWEKLETHGSWSDFTPILFRLSVPHGWLITKRDFRSGVSFYPDEKHEWRWDI